ncbi:MAG TPA: hypothetical protein VFE47_09655 [Tepidisphaeraceae bacterium]|jgi:hypothetical protein|nr:hypothetical protein [Tepidisphaeraceae bacterium]
MSPRDLLNRLHDEPFKPFRVRLTNNSTIDIPEAGLVVVGPTSAIMPVRTMKDEIGYTLVTQWRTIALSHMMAFVDLDPPKSSRKRPA